ncbi:hypothetical protein B0H17DRAFT_1128179 [Mycena rosella]|uniref:Uncharacterized protein n=1 Tax=Mycena rosella TaxID=1033263 RepID=A0AAD7GQG9_MYCRO|nr:hypothetical protein B0H17DRAFT_1128179 [Mycena rosella]
MPKTPRFDTPLLLGSLPLIPNNSIRYTVLALTVAVTVAGSIHRRRPSTQLRQLGDAIETPKSSSKIQSSKASTAYIRRRISETGNLAWKNNKRLSRDIAVCAADVERLHIAVELAIQAERQQKKINGALSVLTAFRARAVHGSRLSQSSVYSFCDDMKMAVSHDMLQQLVPLTQFRSV